MTTDHAEAEHALEWVTDGRIVHRRITYSGWQPDNDNDKGDGDLALAG